MTEDFDWQKEHNERKARRKREEREKKAAAELENLPGVFVLKAEVKIPIPGTTANLYAQRYTNGTGAVIPIGIRGEMTPFQAWNVALAMQAAAAIARGKIDVAQGYLHLLRRHGEKPDSKEEPE